MNAKVETLPRETVLALAIECANMGAKQEQTLRVRSAPIGAAIATCYLESGLSEAGKLATEIFLKVRSQHKYLKDKGLKQKATDFGKGWNRVKASIAAALDDANLVATWPAIISGLTKSGDTFATLRTAAQAQELKNAETEAKREADRMAEEVGQSERAYEELESLQKKSPEQLVADIRAMLQAWGGDSSLVIQLLSETETETETETA